MAKVTRTASHDLARRCKIGGRTQLLLAIALILFEMACCCAHEEPAAAGLDAGHGGSKPAGLDLPRDEPPSTPSADSVPSPAAAAGACGRCHHCGTSALLVCARANTLPLRKSAVQWLLFV